MNVAQEPPRRFSGSRRSLFPAPEDDDSDLGHMSPLSIASSDSESTTDVHYFKSVKNHSADDYDILGDIHKVCDDVDHTPMQKKFFSPEHLSLLTSSILVKGDQGEETIIPDTPVKESPVLKLETPHDTSTQSAGLPKLVRRQHTEEDESPEHKQKCDHNSKAKVRTALFPENEVCVPVKSFYAKIESVNFTHKRFANTEKVKQKKKKERVYLCSRRTRKNRYGQINTGVRHKIKKPKQKKPTKNQILKAAISLLENSPLSEYLEDLKQLQNKPTIIKPIEQKTIETRESKKREHSPDIVNNRKFFKSHTGVQVAIREHDISFVKKSEQSKTHLTETTFDVDDEDKLIDNARISNLINLLEEEKENNVAPPVKRQKIELLSPISQMCDTTSGLALNSPKKARNLTAFLQNMPSHQNSALADMEKKKLFPIFELKNASKPMKDEKPKDNHTVKKWKSLPANQMLLDAGQKRFGPTQCPKCEIIYHMGDPSEEIMHLHYHNAGNVLRFNGWKSEDVVADFLDARIIRIKPNDPKVWWKKVLSLLEVVNKDLGLYDEKLNTERAHVYLYIKNRNIVGCLVAENRSIAHRKIEENGLDLCTEETFPVKCGVSRIWVSPNHRRAGIGTILMDCLKGNFVFGYILDNNDIALSSPTEAGNHFAKKYFKTNNYLIYL